MVKVAEKDKGDLGGQVTQVNTAAIAMAAAEAAAIQVHNAQSIQADMEGHEQKVFSPPKRHMLKKTVTKEGGVRKDGRGRPRINVAKAFTFVMVIHNGQELWKRAPQGRGRKGDVRETFTIHHSHEAEASRSLFTREELERYVTREEKMSTVASHGGRGDRGRGILS